jgi:hypothetical protein
MVGGRGLVCAAAQLRLGADAKALAPRPQLPRPAVYEAEEYYRQTVQPVLEVCPRRRAAAGLSPSLPPAPISSAGRAPC